MSIWTNIKKRGVKDILNPKRVKVYVGAQINKLRGYVRIPYAEIESYCEQYIYRRWTCRSCYDNNECYHCGCKAKEVIAEKSSTCSAGEWFGMKGAKDWSEFKDQNNIVIDVFFGSKK